MVPRVGQPPSRAEQLDRHSVMLVDGGSGGHSRGGEGGRGWDAVRLAVLWALPAVALVALLVVALG